MKEKGIQAEEVRQQNGGAQRAQGICDALKGSQWLERKESGVGLEEVGEAGQNQSVQASSGLLPTSH